MPILISNGKFVRIPGHGFAKAKRAIEPRVAGATFTDSVTLTWEQLKTGVGEDTYGYNAEQITDDIVGYEAFSGCSALTSIVLPDGLGEIFPMAFEGCGNLVSIDAPVSTVCIGYGAFRDCSNLSTVSFPGEIAFTEMGVFEGCTNLESITLHISDAGINRNAISTSCMFAGCTFLTDVNLVSNVTLPLDTFTFAGCNSGSVRIHVCGDSIGGAATWGARNGSVFMKDPTNSRYIPFNHSEYRELLNTIEGATVNTIHTTDDGDSQYLTLSDFATYQNEDGSVILSTAYTYEKELYCSLADEQIQTAFQELSTACDILDKEECSIKEFNFASFANTPDFPSFSNLDQYREYVSTLSSMKNFLASVNAGNVIHDDINRSELDVTETASTKAIMIKLSTADYAELLSRGEPSEIDMLYFVNNGEGS